MRRLRSGPMGSISAWLPSRRSTLHQSGARSVMALSGQVRSVSATGANATVAMDRHGGDRDLVTWGGAHGLSLTCVHANARLPLAGSRSTGWPRHEKSPPLDAEGSKPTTRKRYGLNRPKKREKERRVRSHCSPRLPQSGTGSQIPGSRRERNGGRRLLLRPFVPRYRRPSSLDLRTSGLPRRDRSYDSLSSRVLRVTIIRDPANMHDGSVRLYVVAFSRKKNTSF